MQEEASGPSAVETVGNSDGVYGDGIDRRGYGVGTVGMVEGESIAPLIGGSRNFGDM